MKRRRFLEAISLTSLMFLDLKYSDGDLDKELSKIVKGIQNLTKRDFTLTYKLSSLGFGIGEASVHYSKDTNIIDAGINDFPFWIPFAGLLFDNVKKLYRLKDKRDFVKMNNESWYEYKEGFGLKGNVLENSTFYVYNPSSNCVGVYNPKLEQNVDLFEQEEYNINGEKILEFYSKSRMIYNLLYGLFSVLNNNVAENFALVGGKRFNSDVSLSIDAREEYETIYKILRTEVILPQIGDSKIEVYLLNDIPVKGELDLNGSTVKGKIDAITLDGKVLFD